jgi:uncharacterized protein YqfA (UPF0365 family)
MLITLDWITLVVVTFAVILIALIITFTLVIRCYVYWLSTLVGADPLLD